MTETTVKTETAVEESQIVSPKQDDNKRFTKKRFKKKKLVITALLLLAVSFGVFKSMTKEPVLEPRANAALEKMELVKAINVTGTVESANEVRVHSGLSSTINSVGVKVGDRVEAGDVLAQLDTGDLMLNIAERQAEIARAVKLNQHNIATNQKKYEDAQTNLSFNMNDRLISAQSSLEKAQQELNEARRDYNEAEDDREHGDGPVNAAKKNWEQTKKDLAEIMREYANDNSPEAQKKIAEAQEAEKTAEDAYYDADKEYGDQMSLEGKKLRDARTDYSNALAAQKAAENAVLQELEDYQRNIESAKIEGDVTSQEIALRKLQKDLTESTVTAPISGTVTAVYAKEGAPANGLMFVIENTDDLIIKTKLREYDVASVKEGMPTVIKADATGDKEFSGEVSRIYPAAVKDAEGSTKTDGGVEFETEVALKEQGTGLRVGMSVRLNVIAEKKQNTYAVPFGAVTSDAQGNSIIYTAKPGEEGKMIAAAVPVTTGMETDFYIEVSGEGLTEGDTVLTSPEGVMEGMEIALVPAAPGGVSLGK